VLVLFLYKEEKRIGYFLFFLNDRNNKTITKDGSMNPIGVLPVDWGGVVGGGDGVYTVKE